MLLTRVSVDLDGILGKYKQLHGGMQERMAMRKLRGEPEPDGGAPEPPLDPARREWAGSQPRGAQTFQKRMEQEAKEQKLQEAIARGSVRALEEFRNTDKCPNPECQEHKTKFEVDPDGNAVCPRCGETRERVEEEMHSGEAQIVHREDKRTFKDGPDNRKHTELVEQQENNIKLYVIQPNDVPIASEDQIWWANNRMNQSMLWADLMGADFEMEDGFGISETEIRHVKQLLRQVSVQATMDMATDFYDDDEDEADRDGSDWAMGSPLLWTILIVLHMMTMRPEGFMVATETQQKYATLRDLHAYMKKFAGDQMKMYREQMGSFFTNVKGLDARKAAARMDRIKKRSAVYYPLGADPEKLRAKIEKLNDLLMQTKGNRDGLAKEVLQDERPGLLPLEARRRHVTARNSAVATQDTDTMLVKGKAQRATARDRFGIYTNPVKPDFSKPGDVAKPKGGRGKGGGGGGGKGKGGKGKGKGGKGRRLGLASLQGESDNPYDIDEDKDESNQTPGDLMFATIAKESREAEGRAREEAERKAREEKALKARENWAQKSAWKDELGDLLGTNNHDNAGESSSGAGASSSSGPASDPALLALSVEELETMIAEKQSFLEAEEKSGNYSKEEIERVQQETVQFQKALYEKQAMEQDEYVEMDEALVAQILGDGEEGEAMDVDGDANNNNNDANNDDSNGGIASELVDENGEFVSDEAEAQAMVDLLSIDLSPEAFERHQQEQMKALVEESKRSAEIVKAEREAREAEAARKQAEREAGYDPYNRENDKRNDVEGFIAAGMPIPTPKGNIDGYSGREGGKYYKSDMEIRRLSLKQVQASQNFRLHPFAFVKRWQLLQREWRAGVEAKVAKFEDLERQKAASRAKREALAKEAAERKMQEKLAERGFDQIMTQAAKKEKAEERAEKQGKAIMYVVPSDKVADKTTGFIPTVTLGVAQPSAPKIIIPAEAMKQANASEDADQGRQRRCLRLGCQRVQAAQAQVARLGATARAPSAAHLAPPHRPPCRAVVVFSLALYCGERRTLSLIRCLHP